MLPESFTKLLILQERDLDIVQIQKKLGEIPQDRKKIEDSITVEKEKLAQAKSDLQALEVKSKDLEVEMKSLEAQRVKYKTQQLQVKKNDELQALEHEIELTTQKISDIEDQEINLLLEIDTAKEDLEKLTASTTETVDDLESDITSINALEKNLKEDFVKAEEKLKLAQKDTPEKELHLYERAKTHVKRTPIIVPLKGQTCTGCHLRVSNEVIADAQKGKIDASCDQCNRIVYKP